MHGDRDAFGILAERSLGRLVGTAGLILRDPDAADDACVLSWQLGRGSHLSQRVRHEHT